MGINDNFRYLSMGLPEDVLRLKYYGDFENAIRAIDRHLQADSTPQAMKNCLTAQREIIRRLPDDYPYTKEAALALLREHVPGFPEAEFDALRDVRRIDWIYVRGIPHYFGRFLETLCKTDPLFAKRAGIASAGADGQDGGTGRLDRAARLMRENGQMAARIRCRASVRMKDALFCRGQRVRAYLPLPRACAAQSAIRILNVFPQPSHISPENAPQRVIFWEEDMEENHAFSVEFSLVRTARYADLSRPAAADGETPAADTEEQPPHILFTPYIRELTRVLGEGAEGPLKKARRFYDFITENVRYTFMPAYFGLENIPELGARNLAGDCGVLALLFITLCRCAGIPARWESGWSAGPDFCGSHDWAQFYAPPYGWLYADPSFGAGAVRERNETRRQHYFGNLDPYRMAANSLFQGEFDVPKDHWRADPYDNQVGEMETSDRGLHYDEYDRAKKVLEFTEL